MLHGIVGKSQKAIDDLYRAKEEAFPERHEAEARLATVLDLIDQNLGAQFRTTVFHNKTLFYVLFAVVYDAAYGLCSSFVRKSPNRISSELFQAILQRGIELEKATAPRDVLNATTRLSTHAHERKLLFNYIKGCPGRLDAGPLTRRPTLFSMAGPGSPAPTTPCRERHPI